MADQPQLSIDSLQPDDMPFILELEQLSFNDPYPSWLLSDLARKNPDTFLVAKTEGKTIGYAIIDQWDDHYHLVSIAVHPDSRKRGVATALLKVLEQRLLKDEIIRLEVRRSNEAAISFYLKHGFVRTDEMLDYYADGEDAIIMEKSSIETGTG